jgi:hypothetical protein
MLWAVSENIKIKHNVTFLCGCGTRKTRLRALRVTGLSIDGTEDNSYRLRIA